MCLDSAHDLSLPRCRAIRGQVSPVGRTRVASLSGWQGRARRCGRRWQDPALVGYTDWPGIQPVFRLERTATIKKTGVQRHEVVYGITSLSPHRANAARLLRLSRHHWREATHWIRDVTFDEERSQVRRGHVAEVMAALRNVAIARLHLAGETNIAAACRRLAAQPWAALALNGIRPEN